MNFKILIKEIVSYAKATAKEVRNIVKKTKTKDKKEEVERYDVGIDDIKAAHEKIPKRIGYATVGLGVVVILVLTTMTWTKQVSNVDEERLAVDESKLKQEEVEISIDEQGWKHYQGRRIDMIAQSTQESIASVKKEMKISSEELSKSLKFDLNETKNVIKQYVEDMNLNMTSLKEDLTLKFSQSLLEVDEKLKENENIIKESAQKLTFNPMSSLDANSKLLPPPLGDIQGSKTSSQNVKKEPVTIKEEVIIKADSEDYFYDNVVVDSIEVESGEISTSLYSQTIEKENTMLYHIMKGLTNATLLTGINAPTFGGSNNKTPAPVLFSVDGEVFIANDETENIENCLISGSATGNVNTSKADILLTEISCSGYDTQGNRIKIEEQIKGWVIGEDGSFGLQGRLLDSSGKIITKMIALEIIQSLSDAMVANSMPANTAYGITGQTTMPYNSAAQQGLGAGVNRGLDHTFEHYSKILSGMFPTISVMAGKKVTLHLKGGESLSPSQYNELDISEKLISKTEEMK